MSEAATETVSRRPQHRNDADVATPAPETWEPDRKKTATLLRWRDMPRHLQFNPYIHTGYRPLLTAWGCINSLFYLHNETVNIVTHGKRLTIFAPLCTVVLLVRVATVAFA
jgi:hypothetical protein